MGNSTTLGEAIHTAIQVDPATLESAWQNYLQDIVRQLDQPGQGT
jgi:hypothetical protein